MSRIQTAFKRLVVGRPMSSGELEHTLLPKTIALPVFSSDPLSSNAYATQEAMLVLGMAGSAGLALIFPITIAVACLLTIVIVSYRQTVRAYPNGGGAYIVSKENLGESAGLLAAAALLIDYVLTVSVSITAGVDAITSAAPGLVDRKILLATGFVAFVTLMNLRGVKESGTFFAIPTYGFVLAIYIMLVTGFVRCLGGCPEAESATRALHENHALDLFLILKAFAAGTTALTGVEAISNGVPAFRYPQSRNAATTLSWMGFLSISMFLGISWLADNTGVRFEHGDHQTVVAQIADTIFTGGPMFYVVQIMTAAILILAANTAYQDFPRLASILAKDRYMPHQFVNRGDRLVFSNGVVILAIVALLLIILFDADLNRLIQLYLVGVFVSFTLSQFGMVRHWKRVREPGWRRSIVINAFGGTVTGIVLMVVIATKFSGGAYLVVIATPILLLVMRQIHRHYEAVKADLAHPDRVPPDRRAGHQHAVIFIPKMDDAVARAVGYMRSVRPESLIALTEDPGVSATWKRLAPDIPLSVLPSRGSTRKKVKAFIRQRKADLGIGPHHFLSLVVPELLASKSLWEIIRPSALTRLKGSLLRERGVQVINVPLVKADMDPDFDEAQEPGRNYALVLVSGVHNVTLQAIEYAETLRATDIRAVSFGLDQEEIVHLGDDWIRAGIPHPLEIQDAPFRDIGGSLSRYIKQFRADGRERVVTVVIPEFVVSKTRHQVLHNQTALIVKRRMLFEPGVVVASVPYHLGEV
ncbi:MAG: APC family permease [Actinomycetota bacterium]